MKLDIKYLNKNQPRKTLSNLNFKEDIVYPAHSQETPGFSPYVWKKQVDELIAALKKIRETGNPEHADFILGDYDL